MQRADVNLYMGAGKTERTGSVGVDFQRLIALDTLISAPPRSLTADLSLIGWVNEKVDFLKRMSRVGWHRRENSSCLRTQSVSWLLRAQSKESRHAQVRRVGTTCRGGGHQQSRFAAF